MQTEDFTCYHCFMNSLMTIQQMSRRTGISSHTLRYYEKLGLLDNVARDANGYRCYTEADVSWVEFLILLRDMNMPIQKMQQYSHLRAQGDQTIQERRLILEAHQSKVKSQIEALTMNLEKVNHKIQIYKEMEDNIHN